MPKDDAVDRLRFGTYLAANPRIVAVQELVAEEVGRRLGTPTELIVRTSYDSLTTDPDDVSFLCGLAYVVLQQRGLDLGEPVAAPVIEGERYGGLPIYFSDVIVHRDSPFRSFLDMRGRSWAYNEPLSQSGCGVTRYHLATLGERRGFFGDVVEAGFHRDALRMVASKRVDGAAIDSHALAIELNEHPDIADQVRVIESLGPSTIQPIVVSNRLPVDLKDSIRQALVSMSDDPSVRERLALGLIQGFVPVCAESYDDIRMMARASGGSGNVLDEGF